MNSRTVWLMLAVVLLLGAGVFWQLRRESVSGLEPDLALFPELRAERVQSVRLDHLERGLQLTITREGEGAWQIVDPLDFPAETGVMARLMEVVAKNRAVIVDKPVLSELSLDPPRAVLEVTESLPTGPRKQRLELGAQDLEGKHVFARVDGVVVRTLLNLDSTLDRDLPDWRQRRILSFDPGSVVEVRRSGKVALDAIVGLMDLTFEAGTTETGWRSSKPWTAALDPGLIGSLLGNLCYMPARTFLADSASQASSYGLDHPDIRVELGQASGSEEVLLFRHHLDSQSWVCMREGSTHVFKVDDVSAVFLAAPSDGFLDRRIARVVPDTVERIELQRGADMLSLRRNGKLWMLGGKQAGAPRAEVTADSVAVTDLLAALEGASVARFLIDEAATPFTQDEPRGLTLFTHDAQYGCEFGSPKEASPGIPGRLFRRPGEDVVGVVEDRIAALAAMGWVDFVERQLIQLPEKAIARIELTHGSVKRFFVRDSESGRWSPEGVDSEAPKTFLKCVERLLSLRADTVVAPDAAFELTDPWQISVIDGGSVRTTYRLGRLASDPKAVGYEGTRVRALVTSTGLLEDLELIQ